MLDSFYLYRFIGVDSQKSCHERDESNNKSHMLCPS